MADCDSTDIKDEKGIEVLSIYLYTESIPFSLFFNHLGVK